MTVRRRNASGSRTAARLGLHPADEGLLHHVLGVGDGAEHAVGNAYKLAPERVEARRRIVGSCLYHQAAALA